jgi:hypothetical protein
VREVKRILAVYLLAALAAASGGGIFLRAQIAELPETKRKIRVLVKPQYPELAKKLSLSGLVKIEVTIGPDGEGKENAHRWRPSCASDRGRKSGVAKRIRTRAEGNEGDHRIQVQLSMSY